MNLAKFLHMAHLLLHQQLQLAPILGQTFFLRIAVLHLADNFQLQLFQL